MLNYFCIYLDSKKIEILSYNNLHLTFVMYSKRKIGLKVKDQFVTFKKEPYGDYHFVARGEIETMQLLSKSSDEELNEYRIEARIISVLSNNNALSELAYSLTNISNFERPYLHFARNYVYLNELVYETIINGRVFVSRTAFGKIINSLPSQHINRFIIKLIESDNLNFFKKKDYVQALKELQKYIFNEIEIPGSLLVQSENILRNNLSEIVNMDDIEFLGEEDEKPDKLAKQSSFFKELFSITKDKDIWSIIENEITEHKYEELMFTEMFQNTDWPIKYGEL